VPGDRDAAVRCGWRLIVETLPVIGDQQKGTHAGQSEIRPKVEADVPGAAAGESMGERVAEQLAERQTNQGCDFGCHDNGPQVGIDSCPGRKRKGSIMLVASERVQYASQIDNLSGIKG
jgi:hypothetical protein